MIYEDINSLVKYGVRKKLITADDEIYVRNQLMNALHLEAWEEPSGETHENTIDEILESLVAYACEQGIISDSNASKDLFDTKLIGFLTAMPHEVIYRFFREYEKSPKAAADWYYQYSKDLNYVRAGRIERDIK